MQVIDIVAPKVETTEYSFSDNIPENGKILKREDL
jgi:hypothetical protein